MGMGHAQDIAFTQLMAILSSIDDRLEVLAEAEKDKKSIHVARLERTVDTLSSENEDLAFKLRQTESVED